jgi:hypothetical protein
MSVNDVYRAAQIAANVPEGSGDRQTADPSDKGARNFANRLVMHIGDLIRDTHDRLLVMPMILGSGQFSVIGLSVRDIESGREIAKLIPVLNAIREISLFVERDHRRNPDPLVTLPPRDRVFTECQAKLVDEFINNITVPVFSEPPVRSAIENKPLLSCAPA